MGIFRKKLKKEINQTQQAGIKFINMDETEVTGKTPIVESINMLIAQSFARLDFRLVKEVKGKNGQVIVDEMVKSPLNQIFNLRANSRMSPFDFKETMIYQLLKYGNAMAYIERDKKGEPTALIPFNMAEFEFGENYELQNGKVVLHCKHRKSSRNPFTKEEESFTTDEYIYYDDLIHIRINGNNVFYNESPQNMNGESTIVRVIDSQLNSIINDLAQSGKVKGAITLGYNGYATADQSLVEQDAKLEKQKELEKRLNQNNSFIVLDSGENFQEFKQNFNHLNGEQFKTVKELLFDLYGINQDILNCKASTREMELFFVTKVQPLVEKFVEEINYKCLSPKARTKGYKFQFVRNIFEFLPVDKAVDSVYKSQHNLTQNEIRHDVFKKPAIEGGDELLNNLNFASKDSGGE